MSIKDLPLPLRRMLMFMLVGVALVVAFVPAWIVWRTQIAESGEGIPVTRVIGGYSVLITVPTAMVVGFFVAREAPVDMRRPVEFAVLVGVTVGVLVGLFLSIPTGGYSLLSAPASSLLIFLLVWAFRRVQAARGSDSG